MKTIWMSRVLIGAAALLSAPLAAADGDHLTRLRATIDVSEQLTPTSTPGVSDAVLSGTGHGTHLGALTFTATELIDFRQFFRPDLYPNPRALVTEGVFTITAANGDKLNAIYEGYGVPDPARPGFFNGFATATLTPGTGRFRCASGTVPFTLDINVAAMTEVISIDSLVDLSCECDHDDHRHH